MDHLSNKADRVNLPFVLKSRPKAAFTIIQVIVAAGIVTFCGLVGTQSLLMMNRRAVSIRLMTNARALVEQNIYTALSIPFTDLSAPAILNITAATPAATVVPIATLRDGSTAFLNGNLWRVITAESSTPTIRRITITVAYNYGSQPKNFKGPDNGSYSAGYSMTTLRTTD